MVRYLETVSPETLAELLAFCEDSACGVKAIGPLLSYGAGYSFAQFWEQTNEAGDRTAFLSKYYGSVTVCARPEVDAEELSAFLRAIGFSALIGPAAALSDFSEEGETGCVMTLGPGQNLAAEPAKGPYTLTWDDGYRAFYEVLGESNPGYLEGSFEDFLTDLSHRVRHGTAHTVLLEENGTPAATAAALVETERTVFLGAIATRPAFRGRHYASTVLSALRERYDGRTLTLFCRPDKQAFYEHLGMTKTNDFLECASSWK